MATVLIEEMREQAAKHRFGWSRDEDGEFIVLGRRGGSHIYDPYRPGYLGLCLCEGLRQVRGLAPALSRRVKARIQRERPGWKVAQEGDAEACFLFPIVDLAAALRYVRAPRRRQLTAEQRAQAAARLQKYRFSKTTTHVMIHSGPENQPLAGETARSMVADAETKNRGRNVA